MKEFFNNTNSHIWFALFDRFVKKNVGDDSKFFEFAKAFKEELHAKPVNGKSWDEYVLDNRSSKDKKVVIEKIEMLECLLDEFLHIEKEDNLEKFEIKDERISKFVEEFCESRLIKELNCSENEKQKLAVRYLMITENYDDVKDDTVTYTTSAEFESVINSYPDGSRDGYRFVNDEGKPLTITENPDNNVIKVYYIIDNGNTKTLSYTVEYYKDNVKVEGDTETRTKTVQILEPDTLDLDRSLINDNNKYVEMPESLKTLNKVVTNQLETKDTGNDCLIFDPNALAIGLQKGVQVRMFQDSDYCIKNGLIGFQIYAMLDCAVTQPGHLSLIQNYTGVKS